MMRLMQLRSLMVIGLSKINFLPDLITRIVLAAVFIPAGWGKIHRLGKVVEFFRELHIPDPVLMAKLVAYSEFICGCTILVGFFTRLSAVPLGVIMTVAVLTVKKTELTNITDLVTTGEFLYLVLCLWLLVQGARQVSVDYFLFNGRNSRR